MHVFRKRSQLPASVKNSKPFAGNGNICSEPDLFYLEEHTFYPITSYFHYHVDPFTDRLSSQPPYWLSYWIRSIIVSQMIFR